MMLSSLFPKTCLHGEKLFQVGGSLSTSSTLSNRAFQVLFVIRVVTTELPNESSYRGRSVTRTDDSGPT